MDNAHTLLGIRMIHVDHLFTILIHGYQSIQTCMIGLVAPSEKDRHLGVVIYSTHESQTRAISKYSSTVHTHKRLYLTVCSFNSPNDCST